MPTLRLALAFAFTMLLGVGCPVALAQNCKLSGTPAWNPDLRNIVADCPNEFSSPDGRFVVRIAPDGTMSVWVQSGTERLPWNGPKLEPPAMLSWSPNSKVFFVNDGEGSGMSSSFRLFRLRDNEVLEDESVERTAVALYRRRTRCSPSSADPNVWGFGWDAKGRNIFLLVQATTNEPCGRPDAFVSLIVRESDGAIVETLSKAHTRVRFDSRLPSALFQN
jgi:hypothetical protein